MGAIRLTDQAFDPGAELSQFCADREEKSRFPRAQTAVGMTDMSCCGISRENRESYDG